MNTQKIFWLIVVSCLFIFSLAWGGPITPERAQRTVLAWLRADGAPLETGMGTVMGAMETYVDDQAQTLYYVVNLEPSGFVVVPADDLIEPILAFSPRGRYDPSPGNPLGALIGGDMPSRMRQARRMAKAPATGTLKQAADKWALLQNLADAPESAPLGLTTVSDLRVSPLMVTLWDQLTVNDAACYNYYTPPNAAGSANNYYCGCVATALAQLLRYHQHPLNGVGTATFNIKIKSVATTRSLRGGNGSGGPYAWANMPVNPNSGVTEAQRQSIGALCHDAGVSVNMNYGDDSTGGSSTDTLLTKNALIDTFGYANAVQGYNSGWDIGAGLNAMVNPNLDANHPVLFGIKGDGGHAIVCDGYGYNLSTLYHHLNLGWSGADNAWYALPDIGTDYNFNSVYKCVYNVFVSGSGEIISGRITDSSGTPLANVAVTATRSGGGTYSTNTNSRGIYALTKVPASSTFTVRAAKDGYVFSDQTATTQQSTDKGATSGNRWGINFTASAAPVPTVALSLGNAYPAEAGGTSIVTARLSSASAQTVTVNLSFTGTATLNTDYTRSSASIVIAAGSLTGSIVLSAVQDSTVEGNETIVVDISSVVNGTENGTQQVTATIVDDDSLPSVTLSLGNAYLAEAAGACVVTARLSSASAQAVTVNLSFAGAATLNTDYTRSAASISIPAGSLTGSIALTAIQDSAIEGNETVVVDISSVVNGTELGTQQITATIVDDDSLPTVTLSIGNSSMAEAGGAGVVTARLSSVSAQTVAVNLGFSGTAMLDADFSHSSASIAISSGSLTGSIILTAMPDSVAEGNETIVVDVSSVVNGTESGIQQVTATIVDDDADIPLAEALDNDDLFWSTGGDANWYGQADRANDWIDAAQSGPCGDSRTNWLETTVEGPGTLWYWWAVSSEAGWDWLKFYYDGYVQDGAISGTTNGWEQKGWLIPEGTHTLRWSYEKDASSFDGLDAGWVDQVVWTPSTTAPGNDLFENAEWLWDNGGTLNGASAGATVESGEPAHAGRGPYASIWYQFFSTSDGKLTLDTHGTSFDTVLAIYKGASVNGLTLVAANDDDDSPNYNSGLVDITLDKYTFYSIAVAGWHNEATGNTVLNWNFVPVAATPPANDNFASAETLAGGSGTRSMNTSGATIEAGEPAHAGFAPNKSIWYRITPAAAGRLTLNTHGSGFDTVLAIYSGSTLQGLAPLAANDDDGWGDYTSGLVAELAGSTTYRIAVGGFGDFSYGNAVLNWSFSSGAPPSTMLPCQYPGGNNAILQWNSQPNQTYAIHYATNLTTGFTPLRTNIQAVPPINSYTDSLGNARMKYWRIRTE